MENRCNVCHRKAEGHAEEIFCCPFCGLPGLLKEEEDGWESHPWLAFCPGSCPTNTDMHAETKEEAVDMWSRRASPWRKFSAEPPDKTLPVFVRDKSIDCYYTWPLGAIAEPRLMGEVEAAAGNFEWMAIPE